MTNLTWERINERADAAAVETAADSPSWNKCRLDPRLWEALRIELQARYRRATGEEFATLIVQETTNDH